MSVLSELFDPRVVVRAAPVQDAALERLSEAERRAIERAGPKRRREFATGRLLARGALAELGIEGFDLLNAEDRSPIWPEGVAGTISHSDARALVAVGRRDEVGTLGVDVEHRAELKRELWRMTLLPDEVRWLEARDEPERGPLSLVIFGAKEALYKAQYPRSTTYMGFMDLAVELAPDPSAPLLRGEVRCVFQKAVGPFPDRFVASGRYRRLDERDVVTAIQIPHG